MKFRLAVLCKKLYRANEFCENLFSDSLHKGTHDFLLTLPIFLDWFQCRLAQEICTYVMLQNNCMFCDTLCSESHGVHVVMHVYILSVWYRHNSAQCPCVLWKLTQWKPCLTGFNILEWRLKYRRSVFMYDVLFSSHLNFCVSFTKNINIIWTKWD